MLLPFYPVGGHRALDEEESQDTPHLKNIDIVRDVVQSISGDHAALDFALMLLSVYATMGLVGMNGLPSLIRFYICIIIAIVLWFLLNWRKWSLARLVFALETIEAEYEDE